jgi:hypothetical protein
MLQRLHMNRSKLSNLPPRFRGISPETRVVSISFLSLELSHPDPASHWQFPTAISENCFWPSDDGRPGSGLPECQYMIT